MAFPRNLRQLCRPSFIYFLLSTFALILVALQNISTDPHTLVIGSMSMYVPSVFMIFVIKFIYILFWTWILNLICKDGHSEISWLIMLFPIILTFVGMLVTINR
jgi:hypothetical protein